VRIHDLEEQRQGLDTAVERSNVTGPKQGLGVFVELLHQSDVNWGYMHVCLQQSIELNIGCMHVCRAYILADGREGIGSVDASEQGSQQFGLLIIVLRKACL
jgi:hypothetical protein